MSATKIRAISPSPHVAAWLALGMSAADAPAGASCACPKCGANLGIFPDGVECPSNACDYWFKGRPWECAQDAARVAKAQSGKGKPVALSFGKLLETPPDPLQTLLGDRLLCVRGSLVFIGTAGMGKSSAGMQMAAHWALGRPAFGIHPARPLKITIIQAENDNGDLYEMAHGVTDGMELDATDRETLDAHVQFVSECARTGADFLENVVTPALESFRPDIVWIDPLLAFLGADASDAEQMAKFCRNGLQPLLQRYECAVIVTHHTPKANNRDTSAWRPADWQYAGHGSADLTNWARAMMVVDATKEHGLFRFIAAKRGARFGWRDASGGMAFDQYFRHSREAGVIRWEEAAPDEIEALTARSASARTPTDEQFVALLPAPSTVNPEEALITTREMEARAREAGFSKANLAGIRDRLERERKIIVREVRRGRARATCIGRPEIATLAALAGGKEAE